MLVQKISLVSAKEVGLRCTEEFYRYLLDSTSFLVRSPGNRIFIRIKKYGDFITSDLNDLQE